MSRHLLAIWEHFVLARLVNSQIILGVQTVFMKICHRIEQFLYADLHLVVMIDSSPKNDNHGTDYNAFLSNLC